MNPYLSGIMALSQLTPEQFDIGMQRFQTIQKMQPQGLSALQARQSGLTANMAGGQSQLGQLPQNYTPSPSGPEIPAGFMPTMSTGNSTYYRNPQTGESFGISGEMSGNPIMSEIRPAPEGFEPPPAQPMNERQRRLAALQARQSGLTGRMAGQGILQGPATARPSTGAYLGEVKDSSGNVVRPALSPRDIHLSSDVFPTQYSQPAMPPFTDMNPISDVFPIQYSQPTMSPFSNTQGSFGTGAMPYTQPYYQRSFNPYAGGYGMGFGGGMPSYGGFGGGQQMYGGFGGGKGGGRPSYGGGKGGRGY